MTGFWELDDEADPEDDHLPDWRSLDLTEREALAKDYERLLRNIERERQAVSKNPVSDALARDQVKEEKPKG
jgi:hypothetical protein